MHVIAGLVGSGAGVVTIAAALLLARHLGLAPQAVHPLLARLVVVLMYAGGAALAATQAGAWLDSAARGIAGQLGGFNSGIAYAALTVAAMVLAVGVIVGLIFDPSSADGITAACLPLVLSLTAGGWLHTLYVATVVPAGAYATALAHLIGG